MVAEKIDILPQLRLHKPVRKCTLEEYLRKEEHSANKHEFVNGEIIKMPIARYAHNLIAMNMAKQMINSTEN